MSNCIFPTFIPDQSGIKKWSKKSFSPVGEFRRLFRGRAAAEPLLSSIHSEQTTVFHQRYFFYLIATPGINGSWAPIFYPTDVCIQKNQAGKKSAQGRLIDNQVTGVSTLPPQQGLVATFRNVCSRAWPVKRPEAFV
ncbi:hypothetical protein NIASO_00830 [Niabella soli DSM 19437]|uniref:Uncharacterized protein n=1 Tax=Niabella soli DSM 19437 TaxID=929713 RepID=W0F214_9BACT|nr:hypothetical protein NIASO_00830 [Niabella soli DSM 19437]